MLGIYSSPSLRNRLLAVALFALPLSGCSTMDAMMDGSSFGASRSEIASLPANATYTADGALIEARNHFLNNDFGHSAAFYKKAVEIDPNSREAFVGLGASYDRLGRFDLSDRVYAALLKLSGESVQYYNNVGYSYLLRGNLKAALQNFKRAQALDPDNAIVANNIQMLANARASVRA